MRTTVAQFGHPAETVLTILLKRIHLYFSCHIIVDVQLLLIQFCCCEGNKDILLFSVIFTVIGIANELYR
jgi:hypothetical protein